MKRHQKLLITILAILVAVSSFSQSDSFPNDIDIVDKWNPQGLNQKSLNEFMNQNYPEAIGYATQAVEIYQKIGNRKKEGATLENIGIYYAEFSDYQKSIDFLLKSIEIAEEQNDVKSINSRYFNIGTTYVEASNYRKGIGYLNKSINYFSENASINVAYLVAGYTNIGVAYNGLNIADSAMLNYQMAISIAQNAEEKCFYGGTLLNIAEITNLEGDPDLALKYLEEAIIDFTEDNNQKGVWHAKYEIAHSYFLQKRINDAAVLLEEVISHFYKTNDLAYLEKSLNLISEVYAHNSNFKNSLNYQKQLVAIKDSISKAEILHEMSKLELQYNIDKIHKENEAKLSFLKQEKRISTMRWYFATIFLILIIVFVILLYSRIKAQKQLIEVRLDKSKAERNRLEIELDFKNKELENFALHIVQKTDFLREVKADLRILKSSATDKNKEKINALNLKLNSSLRISNELENFRARVDEVYSKFFLLLGDKFPELTEKEKRLCALLKLNLSSKEIASLNNVSVGAITMARYRLRKKIALENEDSFKDFFDAIEKM